MLLIGSRALAMRAPIILKREPKDFDFICTREEAMQWVGKHADTLKWTKMYSPSESKLIIEGEVPIEFELVEHRASARLLVEAVKNDPDTIHTEDFGMIPTLDVLFLLKKSHRYLKNSPHFWKTVQDYHRMKAMGAVVRPEHEQLFQLREQETYVYKHPKLNVSKDAFFDGDQVPYEYDHDSLHVAVKHLDEPAYRYFQKDGAQVACDRTKFFAASREVQLFSVLEESYVLSIERSQVPHPGVMTPRASFMLALSKVCSSIASGWWREFAYENVFDVLKLYSDSYMDKFRAGVEQGVVKPYAGQLY